MGTLTLKQLTDRFPFLNKKGTWLFGGKIILSVGLIAYLVNRIGTQKLIDALYNGNKTLIALSCLLGVANLTIQYFKWKLLSREILGQKSRKRILYSLFYGIAAGSFTPGRVGEYFGRKIAFPEKRLFEVTVATFADKIPSLFITISAGIVSALFYLQLNLRASYLITTSLFVAYAAALYMFGYILLDREIWEKILSLKWFQHRRVKPYAERLNFLRQLNPRTFSLVFLLNLLLYFCILLQFGVLLLAYDPHDSLFTAIWVGSLMLFSKSMLPVVSIGEIGIRELTAVFFASQFGFRESAGLNASFTLFLINIVAPALAGLLLLFKKPADD